LALFSSIRHFSNWKIKGFIKPENLMERQTGVWVIDNSNALFGEEFWDTSKGTLVFKNQFIVSRCWNTAKEQSFWIPELGGIDWTII
jgi:hypothetical protein